MVTGVSSGGTLTLVLTASGVTPAPDPGGTFTASLTFLEELAGTLRPLPSVDMPPGNPTFRLQRRR
jgi:hypothetical protein